MEAPAGKEVQDVFVDLKKRRSALITALTTDKDILFELCNPEKECLCLYGCRDGSWEVKSPPEELPDDIPDPVSGINFNRDKMSNKDWRLFIARHSQSWLIALAFFYGTYFGFDKSKRNELFELINHLPPLYEVVNRQAQESNRRNLEQMKVKQLPGKVRKAGTSKGKGKETENQIQCSAGNEEHGADELLIGCEACYRWFSGMCAKVTPQDADHIKDYNCPSCGKRNEVRVNWRRK